MPTVNELLPTETLPIEDQGAALADAINRSGRRVLTDAEATRALAASPAFTHQQAVPSDEWTINHNLGFRPVVSVLDTAHNEVVGDIAHPTLNQTVLTFSAAFAGSARLT